MLGLGLGLGLKNARQSKTIINLLGKNGNLVLDSNSDGVADGLSVTNLISCSLSNNVQYIQASATNINHNSQYIISNAASGGDVLYYGGWFKAGKGKSRPVLYNRKSDGTYENNGVIGTLNPDDYEFLSATLLITSCYTPNYSYVRQDIYNEAGSINYAGNGENISFKKLFVINLTKAGKTKAEMDAIVQSNDYFESISI